MITMTFRQDHLCFNVSPDVHCKLLYNIECIIQVYVLWLDDFSILLMQILMIIQYDHHLLHQISWFKSVYVCVCVHKISCILNAWFLEMKGFWLNAIEPVWSFGFSMDFDWHLIVLKWWSKMLMLAVDDLSCINIRPIWPIGICCVLLLVCYWEFDRSEPVCEVIKKVITTVTT